MKSGQYATQMVILTLHYNNKHHALNAIFKFNRKLVKLMLKVIMDHFAMKIYTGQQDICLLKFILTSLPQ